MSSLSALIGQDVIARDTATRLGTADGVVVDAETRRIVAVQLGTKKSSRFVSWEQIRGIGTDAVIIESADAPHDADGPLEARAAGGHASMLGKLVLDDDGDALGTVDDVAFNESTGTVDGVRVADRDLDGDRLLGIGSYAVVVRSDHTVDASPR
ncbi:MAG: PRC-barrel domain-containing protein [Acidimicrobiia bacterium]